MCRVPSGVDVFAHPSAGPQPLGPGLPPDSPLPPASPLPHLERLVGAAARGGYLSLPPSRGLLCQQPGEGQTDTCSPALPASGLALTHLLHALPLQPGILASRPCPPSPRPCAWGVCESCVCLRCGSVVLLCLSHAVCSVCVHCVQGMCVCVSGVALRCLCVCVCVSVCWLWLCGACAGVWKE